MLWLTLGLFLSLIILGSITYYLYNTLSDTSLSSEIKKVKLKNSANWIFWIGVAFLLLVVIAIGIIKFYPSLGITLSYAAPLLGLLFLVGVLLIVIGVQMKGINESSLLSDDQKNAKYLGFTTSMGFVTGIILGALAGSLAFKKPSNQPEALGSQSISSNALDHLYQYIVPQASAPTTNTVLLAPPIAGAASTSSPVTVSTAVPLTTSPVSPTVLLAAPPATTNI